MRTAKNKKGDGLGIGIMTIILILVGGIFFVGIAKAGGLSLCGFGIGCGTGGGDQLVVNFYRDNTDIVAVYTNVAGTPKEGWKFEKSGLRYTGVAVGDLNGDGLDEIVVGTQKGVITVIYPEEYHVDNAVNDVTPAMAIGDFDKDGRGEIALISHRHPQDVLLIYDEVTKYSRAALLLKTYQGIHIDAMAAEDFDGDGKTDLALGTETGQIKLLTNINLAAAEGEKKFDETDRIQATGDFKPNNLVAGHFTGQKDVVGLAYITNYDDVLWIVDDALRSTPRGIRDYGCDMSALAAGDFDGDGRDDTAAICNNDNALWIITETNAEKSTGKKVADFSRVTRPIATGKFTR